MKRKIILLAVKIIIAAMVFIVLFQWIFGLVRVRTNAMAPNVNGGDLAFIYHLDRNYRVGDVVIYRQNGKKYFSRIVALSGSTVDIKDGELSVNSIHLDSSKVFAGELSDANNKIVFPQEVREGCVFLLNDNYDDGDDSRRFGPVEESMIEGKVLSIVRTRDI